MDFAKAKAEEFAAKAMDADKRKELIASLPEGTIRQHAEKVVSQAEMALAKVEASRDLATSKYEEAKASIEARRDAALRAAQDVIEGLKHEVHSRVDPYAQQVRDFSAMQIEELKAQSARRVDEVVEKIFNYAEQELDVWLPGDGEEGLKADELKNLKNNTVSSLEVTEADAGEEGQAKSDFRELREKYVDRSRSLAKNVSRRFAKKALSKLTDLKLLSEEDRSKLETIDLIEYAKTHLTDTCNELKTKAAHLIETSSVYKEKGVKAFEDACQAASDTLAAAKNVNLKKLPDTIHRAVEEVVGKLMPEKDQIAQKFEDFLSHYSFLRAAESQIRSYSQFVAKNLVRSTVLTALLNFMPTPPLPFQMLWDNPSQTRTRFLLWSSSTDKGEPKFEEVDESDEIDAIDADESEEEEEETPSTYVGAAMKGGATVTGAPSTTEDEEVEVAE
eukprot:CAMPEP_0113902230 /NCGR_PEP_ID=MMETSP0780_2-20120614/21726_1 /TAXON_ID=652834 /ORGANISM="Palpitomonas bilix" /LENGTH=446 /DNA_ID=CAMNT_0000894995 /DNA_START=154 /DNA_END=1494 /DNA_ORIENTATION=+ /assembly_acc=CAM_ASM_000599